MLLVLVGTDVVARLGAEKVRVTSAAFGRVRETSGRVQDRQLAVYEAVIDDSYEIFIHDAWTGQTRQLTSHFGNDRFPILSPDHNRVAFVSWRDGNSEIYLIELETEALLNLSNHVGQDMLLESAWSPDSTLLAFVSRRGDNVDIGVADVTRRLTQHLTHGPHYDSQPIWMDNSRNLIFTSDRDGAPAQYVIDLGGHTLMRYPAGNRWQAVQNPATLESPLYTMPG